MTDNRTYIHYINYNYTQRPHDGPPRPLCEFNTDTCLYLATMGVSLIPSARPAYMCSQCAHSVLACAGPGIKLTFEVL